MKLYKTLNNIVVAKGEGIDNIVDETGIHKIIVLDEDYADLYSDYTFLGYSIAEAAFANNLDALSPLHTALTLQEEPAILVCGKEVDKCTTVLAAYAILKKNYNLLAKAARIVEELYGECSIDFNSYASIKALKSLLEIIEVKELAVIDSLASTYNYGKSYKHYTNLVTKTLLLTNEKEPLYISLLSFLFEGPGKPNELLALRLEALRTRYPQAYNTIIKSHVGLLKNYIEGKREWPYCVVRLAAELEADYIETSNDKIIVHCLGEGNDNCMKQAIKARRNLPCGRFKTLSILAGASRKISCHELLPKLGVFQQSVQEASEASPYRKQWILAH